MWYTEDIFGNLKHLSSQKDILQRKRFGSKPTGENSNPIKICKTY